MLYLAVGVALVLALLFGLQAFVNADPKTVARALRYAVVIGLVALAVVLAVTGRAIVDPLIGGVILFLLRHWLARGLPGLARVRDWLRGSPSAAGQSTVETAWLRMALDRGSGALDGEILQGMFQGAKLSQLGLEQLRALLRECAVTDAQSARLIETYLDRVHAGWRDQDHTGDESAGRGPSSARMTREEAWQVLGSNQGQAPTKYARRIAG